MRKYWRLALPAVALAGLIGLAVFSEPIAAQAKKAKGPAAGAKFEINFDKKGEYRFKLVDGDGSTIAMGVRGYDSLEDCQEHIDYVKKEAGKAKTEDNTKDAKKPKAKESSKEKP
jgi:uncharacterized protein YegP (UPF0339 family)